MSAGVGTHPGPPGPPGPHSGSALFQDQLGQLSSDGLSQVHWVSFLDGRQRVLLFTEDVAVVTKARQAEDLEQFQQEVKVSLQNLGLSLINNSRRQEIAYVGITRWSAALHPHSLTPSGCSACCCPSDPHTSSCVCVCDTSVCLRVAARA